MEADNIRKFFERFEGAITALILGLAAIIGTTTKIFEVLRSPLEWSWPEFVFAGAAATILLGIILRARGRHVSRLRDPDALKLDPRSPDQLVGRGDDLGKLLNTLANPLVFLVSESGCGKSALLRAGIEHNPDFTSRFLPIYLDMSALDWEDGPLRALRDGFAQALPADDPARPRLTAHSGPRAYSEAFRDYHQRTMRRTLLLLDQFDDYQAQPRHRDRFWPRQTQEWRRAREIAAENEFWRVLRAGLEAGTLHVVVAVRDEASPGLECIRLLPEPPVFMLPRLERGLVLQIIERLTAPRTDKPPVIDEPSHGWTALRDRLAEELEARGPILPQQLKVILAGLRTLKRLTLADYARAGRVAGLEAAFVAGAIERAAHVSSLRDADVLRLLVTLVDRTRQPPDKAPPHGGAELAAAEGLATPAVERALATLAQDDVTRPRGDDTGIAHAWQLDHAYLAQPILRLQRDRDRWRIFLADRARSHAEVGWRHGWGTLLSPREQVVLLAARLRGRLHYGEFRSFALLSLARGVPTLAFLGLVTGAVWVVWQYDRAGTIEQRLASLRYSPEPIENEAADALGDLSAGSFVVRWRVQTDVFQSPQDAEWFDMAPDKVLRALVRLDAVRLRALIRQHVTPEALRQPDDRLRRAAGSLARVVSIAPVSPQEIGSLQATLTEVLDSTGVESRTDLIAVADGLRFLAPTLPLDDPLVGAELVKLRAAIGAATDRDQLSALAQAYAAVAGRLREGDPLVGPVLGKLRDAIGGIRDVDRRNGLSQAYAAVAARLDKGDPLAGAELGKLREAMDRTMDLFQFAALAQAYAAMTGRLKDGDPLAGAELGKVREAIGGLGYRPIALLYEPLETLSQAYVAMAGKLREGDKQVGAELGKLREAIVSAADPTELNVLSRTYPAMAGRLREGDPLAGAELGKLREAIVSATDPIELNVLSQAYAAMAGRLREGDSLAGRELGRLREAMDRTMDLFQFAALAQAYAAVAGPLKEGDPLAGAILGKLREAIVSAADPSQLIALSQAYAAVAARLTEGDPLVGAELGKLREAMPRTMSPFPFAELAQAYAAMAGRLREGDPLVGMVLSKVREAIGGATDFNELTTLSQAYAAVAGRLREGDPLAGAELDKLREAIGGTDDSDRLGVLLDAYAMVADKARLAAAPTMDIAVLRASAVNIRGSRQFLSLARAEMAAARLGSPPLNISQIGILVTDLLLQPLSAAAPSYFSPPGDAFLPPGADPTKFLVDEYETLLRADPSVPEPKPSWSGDVWAFVAWARNGGLPGFDPHSVRLDFLPRIVTSTRSAIR